MADSGHPFDQPPDPIVFAALIAESVLLGHDDPNEGVAWAVTEGYISLDPALPDDRNIRILDAGREHVAAMVTRA